MVERGIAKAPCLGTEPRVLCGPETDGGEGWRGRQARGPDPVRRGHFSGLLRLRRGSASTW